MKRVTPYPTVCTVDLDHAQLLVIHDHPGTRVRVLFGGLWLTEAGRPDDRFARPGDELLLSERGRAVLEGIGQARLEIAQPASRWLGWLHERIDAMRHDMAWVLTRGLALAVALVLGIGLPDMLARGFQQAGGDGSVAPAVAAASPAPMKLAKSAWAESPRAVR